MQQQESLLYAKDIEQSHEKHINDEIEISIQKKDLLLCVVDDYHCIHTKRRPKVVKVSAAKHMCSIVIKIFPEIRSSNTFASKNGTPS